MKRETKQDWIEKQRKTFLMIGAIIALEAVRNIPDWIPGKQRGVPVRVRQVVPFKFKLQ